MANTSARMLRLLSLLQSHRHWPGAELADRLAVSERTLRRDIDQLRDLSYPVDASRGVAGGYRLRSGTAMPPLLLDDEEAVAIAVGLGAAAGGGPVAGVEETSLRALTKVIQVMPPRLRRRVEALRSQTAPAGGTGPAVDPTALTVLAQASRDGERLRFAYATGAGERSARLVEPHHLVPTRHHWYLVAWDVERGDWRTFRVDRLTAPTTTGTRFRPRELPGGDAAAYVRDRLATRPTRYDVAVRIHASADQVGRVVRFTGGNVEPLDARSCRLRAGVDDLAWAVLILAATGAGFEVEAPDELREYLRTTGRTFLAAADRSER